MLKEIEIDTDWVEGVKIRAPGGVIATRAELIESIEMFTQGGGYILGPDAYLPEVMEVVEQYGCYPLG